MITIFTCRCLCDLYIVPSGPWRKRRSDSRALARRSGNSRHHALCKKMPPHTHTHSKCQCFPHTHTHTQCCSQAWTDCCAKSAELLNSNSTTNADHGLCVQEAREQLFQEAASPVVASVTHSVEKGANCSLSSKQRVRCLDTVK